MRVSKTIRYMRPIPPPPTKQCNLCTREGLGPKPIEEFHKNKRSRDGHHYYCKQHMRAKILKWQKENRAVANARGKRWKDANPRRARNAYLKYRFNISVEHYEALFQAQGGVCAICKSTCEMGQALAVDHDRACCAGQKSCGKCVRALLCRRCNAILGRIGEDDSILESMIMYLRRRLHS